VGEIILAHEDSCLRLSIHPKNDHVILTAGQDWTVKLWDMRTRRVQGTVERFGRRQNYVSMNPTNPYYFVTSDDRGGMLLYDLRSAFSHVSTSTHILEYTTRLCQDQKISRPVDVTSAVWNSDGTMLCANIQRWVPTLYSLNDPDPVGVLQEPRFSSLATVKTGSFCETIGESFYFAGGDDGTTYGWEVPRIDDLLEERKFHSHIPPHEIRRISFT
jgi:DDB1- and CUL4-associated factor 5